MTEIHEKKSSQIILLYKKHKLNLINKSDFNFFKQKFIDFLENNSLDVAKIIENLDSKNFTKQIFNHLLKIEHESVLQAVFERFFVIFFNSDFKIFDKLFYFNILKSDLIFFPYDFSLAVLQNKLIFTSEFERNMIPLGVKIHKNSESEGKKNIKTENSECSEDEHIISSVRAILKRSKKNIEEMPIEFVKKIKKEFEAIKQENLETKISDISIKKIEQTKLSVEKNLLGKNKQKFAEILNPHRFFDTTTKNFLMKLSNLYTQESLLYVSIILRIVPFSLEEKISLIKDKNLFIKLLDAEDEKVRAQSLITMFLFIDSEEVFENYFDSFVDSLYDESDIVVQIASELMKLLCFKYKCSIENDSFQSLQFMIGACQKTEGLRKNIEKNLTLKKANLQIILVSCVNSNSEFIKYFYELFNYEIQIKELVVCVRNNFNLLIDFFTKILLENVKMKDYVYIKKDHCINKSNLQEIISFIFDNLKLRLLIKKLGDENVVLIPILILCTEFILKNKLLELSINENKKFNVRFYKIFGIWFYEMSFKEFCLYLQNSFSLNTFSEPEAVKIKELEFSLMDPTLFQKIFNNRMEGLRNKKILSMLLNCMILGKMHNDIKECIKKLYYKLQSPCSAIQQFNKLMGLINSENIIFFSEIFKTETKIFSISDLIKLQNLKDLFLLQKYLYKFEIVDIKRISCFSKDFSINLLLFGDFNSNLCYKIFSENSEKEKISNFYKTFQETEIMISSFSNLIEIQLCIRIEDKSFLIEKKVITLSKSLL